MDLGLAGRVALVLASSKGIGRATAEALAAEGADLAIGARTAHELDATAAAIRKQSGRRVVAIPIDVTDARRAQECVDTVMRELGRIDILVNNAGGPPFGKFNDFDDEAWHAAFELSLHSTVRMTRLVLPHLPRDGHGRIINIISFSVRTFVPGSMLSTAMRAGVVGMSKLLAEEIGPLGITVNNVAPGLILTDRLKHFGAKPEQAQAVPLRRFGRADEVASVVTFLASERASYVTGMTIAVDGGAVRAIS